ncbi:translocase [Marivita sp. GX14005]|uniref:translocase n=1 Tax=Marivita sp. GX14005 TaxID=2942276 RepID=UPI002018A1BD|nr:translocase [Marivita sp. GX14005]MCL3881424.1 translocase [Marivita sp. GX14005]
MKRKISTLVAAGSVAVALGIGAAMQYLPFPAPKNDVIVTDAMVSDMQDVSSTPKAPLPVDAAPEAKLPSAVVNNAALKEPAPDIELPSTPAETGFTCDAELTATPAAGAMLSVLLTAPCHGSERVTLHHNGLMVTEVMQPDGTLSLDLPALAENALVIASFPDGSGAVAHAEVSSVPFYDRIVLQWRGDAGLQLHAREFDAAYFSDGHIWMGANADPKRAARGEGGFLTRIGQPDVPDALLAEIYTFPAGMTSTFGTVAITVEAEIQPSNCDRVIEAQTLEIRNGRDLRSKELTIDVPGCDSVGDFLLLKNVVEDLTIAAR